MDLTEEPYYKSLLKRLREKLGMKERERLEGEGFRLASKEEISSLVNKEYHEGLSKDYNDVEYYIKDDLTEIVSKFKLD